MFQDFFVLPFNAVLRSKVLKLYSYENNVGNRLCACIDAMLSTECYWNIIKLMGRDVMLKFHFSNH